MTEDTGSRTEADAAAFERERGQVVAVCAAPVFVMGDSQHDCWCVLPLGHEPRDAHACRHHRDQDADLEHVCSECADCIHDGRKCCGCYDGACCHTQGNPDAAEPEPAWVWGSQYGYGSVIDPGSIDPRSIVRGA